MKVKVVGIQTQDYKLDNGYEFKGRKLHCIDMDSERKDLQGNLTLTMKIPSDTPLGVLPIEVGEEYTVYFNQKGGVDYLANA